MTRWLLAVLLLGGAVTAHAHSGATGIVKERMDLMKAIGQHTKALGWIFKQEAPYDALAVALAATEIRRHAGDRMTELFPEGSTAHPSEAKEAIWSDWSTFAATARDLENKAVALAAVAGDGLDAAKPAFAAVVGTCKTCHRAFKAD